MNKPLLNLILLGLFIGQQAEAKRHIAAEESEKGRTATHMGVCITDAGNKACKEDCDKGGLGLLGKRHGKECCICLAHIFDPFPNGEKPFKSIPSYYKITDADALQAIADSVAKHEQTHLPQCQETPPPPPEIKAAYCREAEAYGAEAEHLKALQSRCPTDICRDQLKPWIEDRETRYHSLYDSCYANHGQIPIPASWCDHTGH